MKKYKKGSIEYIIKNDITTIKYDRDELLEEMKKHHDNCKELDFIVKTICKCNLIIDELENILERYENSKKESK